MKEKYAPLFTPWKIGNVEIKNRIVMCPMGGTSLFGWMEANHFDKEAANLFLEIAKNNVGLIIPGIAPIRDTLGGRWLWKNKKMFKELKPFMDEIHKTGAKLFVQLTAGMGRSFAITDPLLKVHKSDILSTLAKPIIDIRYLSASPSELPLRWAEGVKSREMTKKEIQEIVEGFAKTAKLCKEAGVDGVEVHAVHEGYLLDQFTLEYTNKRTDEYGGSFENRYRFPVEILKAIKEVCGEDYPVSLRYSVESKVKGFCEGAIPGEEYVEIGRDMEESKKAAKYLQDMGYDMLNCDNGTYDSWYWNHPPQYMPLNCNLPETEHIKNFVDIPVVCAGRMEPEDAARAIEKGTIDGMGVARQFLCDTQWITKLLEERLEEVKPCICCHNACFNMSHYKGVANAQSFHDASHIARCALNPETMQTKKYYIRPTNKKKSIAIIGGGIGGMEAGLVASKRGHDVTIYEKTAVLGGVFIPAAAPSYKEKDRLLIDWYRREISESDVKVEFNTEIKSLDELRADEVIIATGGLPINLPIKGCMEYGIQAVDFLSGKQEVGEEVIIVGGGLTGCEIALELYIHGKKPTIIEMKDDLVAMKDLSLANASYLRDFFKAKKVPVHLETRLKEVLEDGVIVTDKDGKDFEIKGDSVIISAGYRPAPLFDKSRKVHLVGDCKKIGNLRTVIWSAWDVAMKL